MTTKKTPTHDTIAAAIAAAQGEMSNATQDATNPHFGTQYASLAAIRDIVVPSLNSHGVAVLQTVEGECGQCTVRTVLLWGDQSIEAGNCTLAVGAGRNAAQDVGAITTYLRRYQLAAVGGIAQEDADGNSLTTQNRQQAAPRAQGNGRGEHPPQTAGGRTGASTGPQQASSGNGSPRCPACKGDVWDNRATAEGNKPQWRCKNGAACPGGQGHHGWASWDPDEFDKRARSRAMDVLDDARFEAHGDPNYEPEQPPTDRDLDGLAETKAEVPDLHF